jgi:hypothetical protein
MKPRRLGKYACCRFWEVSPPSSLHTRRHPLVGGRVRPDKDALATTSLYGYRLIKTFKRDILGEYARQESQTGQERACDDKPPPRISRRRLRRQSDHGNTDIRPLSPPSLL